MPITIEQFEIQFNKLQGSFGYTKSPKILEAWYEEFEYSDYQTFLATMKKLRYGEKFPTFAMFKAEYKNVLGASNQPGTGEIPGCEYCHGGTVLYRDYVEEARGVRDLAGNCGVCNDNSTRGLKNIDGRLLIKDQLGILRTKKAVELDSARGDMSGQVNRKADKKLVTKLYGSEDPQKEKIRAKNLWVDKQRDEEVPF